MSFIISGIFNLRGLSSFPIFLQNNIVFIAKVFILLLFDSTISSQTNLCPQTVRREMQKLLFIFLTGAMVIGCQTSKEEDQNASETPASSTSHYPGWATTGNITTTASGLKYIDLKVGSGAPPTAGREVTVHYSGYLTNGMKFDSSVDRNEALAFTLGVGQVIKGWDEGLLSMKTGGKRKLIIPPPLGYGAYGNPPVIPPNAELIFDIELLAVK
jgi:peptidylprolyl isomerase